MNCLLSTLRLDLYKHEAAAVTRARMGENRKKSQALAISGFRAWIGLGQARFKQDGGGVERKASLMMR
jgi:hypothetical protein